jgi:hypothetical protein
LPIPRIFFICKFFSKDIAKFSKSPYFCPALIKYVSLKLFNSNSAEKSFFNSIRYNTDDTYSSVAQLVRATDC